MFQLIILIVFPSLMVFSAFSDLFTMTISNRVSLALVLVFIPFAYIAGLSPAEIGLHVACGCGVLVLTFAMFAMGWVGGGDAKLAASTALWMGWAHVADYGLDAAVLGGVLTLFILFARVLPLPLWAVHIGWITRLHDRGTGIPYGIALALAGLLTYPETAHSGSPSPSRRNIRAAISTA